MASLARIRLEAVFFWSVHTLTLKIRLQVNGSPFQRLQLVANFTQISQILKNIVKTAFVDSELDPKTTSPAVHLVSPFSKLNRQLILNGNLQIGFVFDVLHQITLN